MAKARAQVIISGRVQGVYFRAETREQALALEVAGWVRNRPDGTVEGVFEGERDRVEKLIGWCHQGPPGSAVSAVQVDWQDYRGEYSDFIITY